MTESPGQYKIVFDAATLDAARSASGFLGEILEPPPVAVTQFEVNGGASYRIDAYFEDAPDLAAIAEAVAFLDIEGLSPPRAEDVPAANWVAISQAALPPVEAGRFIVHGSHDAERIGRRHGALLIDAGEAFGTAHHATTLGCLLALDRLVQSRAYRSVLDLGCGSGVLAIAAARVLPLASIIASDIDPIAVEVAAGNARRNGARNRVRCVTATGLDHPALRAGVPYDLVLANILAGPLIALAPGMRGAVAPAGHVVLSGLLSGQAPDVIAAYRAQGFRVVRRADLTGWSTLVLQAAPLR